MIGTARSRRAAAAVEMALLLPLLLVMLFGLWEVGTLVHSQQILSNAAREGERQASTGQLKNSEIAQVVRDYLGNAGLPTGNATVTVRNLTQPGADASEAAQFDRIEVAASLPLDDVRPVDIRLVTTGSTRITGRVLWYSMKDRPYPAPPEPPIE